MARKPYIKQTLVYFFLIAVFLPLIFFIIPGREAGQIHKTETVNNFNDLNIKSWLSGEFQKSFVSYMNNNLGFFPFFIKVRNQVDYSLFHKTHTGEVIAGKEEYLYEQGYIDAYFGKDYVGDEKITKTTRQLKALQDSLDKREKLLIFCSAPGKASYFPEYIPYEEEHKKQNSREYAKSFKDKGINHIDVLPWFLEMKDTLGYLLYPQYGIHWSYYGSTLVADSIVKRINGLTKWSLPELKITSTERSLDTRYNDEDIVQAMNLLVDIQSKPMIYPTHEWVGKKKKKKSILVIGDSFSWDLILRSRIGKECFDSLACLYYNNIVFNKKEKALGIPTLTRHINLEKYLAYFDVILIISSEPNMSSGGFNFIEDALTVIRKPGSKIRKRNKKMLKNKCKTDRKWREDLEKRAEERSIDLDSMIQIYLFDENFKPYPN